MIKQRMRAAHTARDGSTHSSKPDISNNHIDSTQKKKSLLPQLLWKLRIANVLAF